MINWLDVPLFGCPFETTTFQLVLHETSNIIDVFIKNKPVCDIWNCGLATIGIQNASGQYAVTPQGRNAERFIINNSNSEGWRFSPNGPSLLNNIKFQLFKNNNLIATKSGIQSTNAATASFNNLCINNNESASFFVKASIKTCGNDTITLSDSMSIAITNRNVPNPIIPNNLIYCQNDIAPNFNVQGQNLKWYFNINDIPNINAAKPNTTNPGTITNYVTQTIDGCVSAKTPVIYKVVPKTVDTVNVTICKNSKLYL